MERYVLLKLNEEISDYSCMIVATSYSDPLESMEQIALLEANLKNECVQGTILFDMLTCVGDNSERYLTLAFDGTTFDLDSCQFIQVSKESNVRKLSMNAFQQLKDNLCNTVLNSKQINLLLHGVAI